jgi:hypothetical protein
MRCCSSCCAIKAWFGKPQHCWCNPCACTPEPALVHLQEQKALKDQIKRLGKKAKDDAVRLEAEMAARHAAELAALEGKKEPTAAEAVAVADSLYAVHLGDEAAGEQQGKVGLEAAVVDTVLPTSRGLQRLCKQRCMSSCSRRCSAPRLRHGSRVAFPRLQKPSKGQKRREARQREEEERAARIQAEQAELGDSGEGLIHII